VPNVAPFVVALFGAVIIARMLLLGSAAADGEGLKRDEQPAVFWGVVTLAISADAALFVFAFLGKIS
jgi:hypothetical protein